MTRNLLAIAALACSLSTAPMFAQNPHISGYYTVPVTGTTSTGQNLAGTFVIKAFANINNTLNAVGTLTIANQVTSVAIPVKASNPTTALAAANAVYPNSSQAVTMAAAAAPSCPVLNLVLGPLNLNLLGLNVSLNQVVLNVAAIRAGERITEIIMRCLECSKPKWRGSVESFG